MLQAFSGASPSKLSPSRIRLRAMAANARPYTSEAFIWS
jgi:hypothetical protein